MSVFIQEPLLHAISMSTYKIYRHIVFVTIVNHLRFPGCSSSGGTTNPVFLVYTFNGLCSVFVKFEIILLCSCPKTRRKIWFIPHFKIPGLYFICDVTLCKMFCKILY